MCQEWTFTTLSCTLTNCPKSLISQKPLGLAPQLNDAALIDQILASAFVMCPLGLITELDVTASPTNYIIASTGPSVSGFNPTLSTTCVAGEPPDKCHSVGSLCC